MPLPVTAGVVRRQAPQSDIVSQLMSMFNFTADGGPGQMLTSIFTSLMNQTSSLFGPFVGSRGGDGIAFFNQLMQQFMSVFGQMSGLWTNRVSRQTAAEQPVDAVEREMSETSADSLAPIGDRIHQMKRMAATASPLQLLDHMLETRRLMSEVLGCMNQTALQSALPQVSLNTSADLLLMEKAFRRLEHHVSRSSVWEASSLDRQPVSACVKQSLASSEASGLSIPVATTAAIDFEDVK